jgi:hypothetical protein
LAAIASPLVPRHPDAEIAVLDFIFTRSEAGPFLAADAGVTFQMSKNNPERPNKAQGAKAQ